MKDDLDIFGDPVDADSNGKRGRPAHKPTVKNRNRITVLLALGWSQKRIANALGITRKTLRKYYFPSLGDRDQALDKVLAVLELCMAGEILDGCIDLSDENAE